jgi:hypothetical protein
LGKTGLFRRNLAVLCGGRMIFYSARRICHGYITQMIWQNDEFENIVKERFQKALDFARVFWYNVVT